MSLLLFVRLYYKLFIYIFKPSKIIFSFKLIFEHVTNHAPDFIQKINHQKYTYNIIGDYMLIKIKKLQLICGIILLMQVLCPMWIIPFHLLAVILSIVIIGWQKKFCVLQVQYHYYVLALYCFRVWLLGVDSFVFLETIYMCLCLYFSIMIILFSFRAIL